MGILSLFGGKSKRNARRPSGGSRGQALPDEPFATDLRSNLDKLGKLFPDTLDLTVRRLQIRATGEDAALVYIDGLTDKIDIHTGIIRPLLMETGASGELPIEIGRMVRICGWNDLTVAVLKGSSVLLVEGSDEALVMRTGGWPQRDPTDPKMETSLRGAQQGFVETIEQNIAMIRRYLPNRELKFKNFNVGRRGNTQVSIAYLEDVANPDILRELEDRIGRLDIDLIINTGELAELIEDNPYSPFPQLMITERPDAAVSQIAQGRFVVLVDRSPTVLIGPSSFVTFFQNIDDYSTRWSIATFIRMLRFLAFFISISLPAFYIAVTSFNFELVPIKLLITIGTYRGTVPFAPFIEAAFMELTLEMIREAGVRLPSPIGQTVGIVGGIVIGQAIVQAGLISNIMVVVVAFTAISSFILPNLDMVAAVRIIRFSLMAAASMFGIFGLLVGFMILVGHMISLETLGTPFSTPFAPMRFSDWRDTVVRSPLWKLTRRPLGAHPAQTRRQGDNRPKGDG